MHTVHILQFPYVSADDRGVDRRLSGPMQYKSGRSLHPCWDAEKTASAQHDMTISDEKKS